MAILNLRTLAKTSVDNYDYIGIENIITNESKKITMSSLFPAMSTTGVLSESIWINITNKNQLNFKGIKSGDKDLLTVTTSSNNIVLTALEAGIDLSLCNNLTSGFMTGIDFTELVTGVCSVVNGGTGLDTISKGAVLYAIEDNEIAATEVPGNGSVLVGNATTGVPAWTTLTAGTGISITNGIGSITITSNLPTMSSILDMANYNIDLGTGYISADGSTSSGIRVTGAHAYIGATSAYHDSDVLNLSGGGIRFDNTADVNIYPNATTSTTAGKTVTIAGGASASAAAGALNITGGTASGTGAGGSITLTGGQDTGGSDNGHIILKTYTGGSAVAAVSVVDEGQHVYVDTGDLIMSTGNVYMRNSSNPDVIKYQGAQATTDDGTTAVSVANILTGIVQCTPTADKSKATDTAANLISGLSLNVDNDSFDFSFISLATDGSSHVTLTAGTDVTLVGCMVISAQDLAQDAFTSGVARFRIRRTASDTVTLYRIG
tara:strand:+ start:767 stop:2242 length:1476 start_codon:yes stop_codon:yes gene_type:complete